MWVSATYRVVTCQCCVARRGAQRTVRRHLRKGSALPSQVGDVRCVDQAVFIPRLVCWPDVVSEEVENVGFARGEMLLQVPNACNRGYCRGCLVPRRILQPGQRLWLLRLYDAGRVGD